MNRSAFTGRVIQGRCLGLLCSTAIILAPGHGVHAHAEHDKARYVAESGVDTGRCDDPAKPCKTIAYAATHSNKGDTIRVAAGNYFIEDADTLFYLLSDLVPISGQYSQKNSFAKPSGASITRLVGVPLEYAEPLAEKGFTVIVDSKSRDPEKTTEIREKIRVFERLKQARAATACENGLAGDHACRNVDLLAHVPISAMASNASRGNDVWGHYDLNDGKEYAIMGLNNAVAVVEVTDPENPRVVDSVPGQSTTWRDIKVYQYFNRATSRWDSYAYVTADNASVGMMILDLRELPDSISLAATDKTDLSAHNIYLSNVDYSTGIALNGLMPYLHMAGSNRQGGAFNSYGLSDPEAPAQIYLNQSTSRGNYTHDASSTVIYDSRKDNQCVNAGAHCEVLFDFNENSFQVWDKTINSSPIRLSETGYTYASYVHSGWYTEDKQVVVVHDELDEQQYGLNTTVRFFELADLRAPTLLSTWTGPTAAIDHNGFVRGNRYYMSNYTRGLTVLDISDPFSPSEVGFFDTFPVSDNTSFNGAWGVYPFLPSGNILISDINSGLYVVRDNTLSPPQGNAAFGVANYAVEEGELLSIAVQRNDGTEGAVSVKWEMLAGATSPVDLTLNSGILEWADGQSDTHTLQFPIAADGNAEPAESFIVRLYDPQNAMALKAPNMTVVTIAASGGNIAPSVNAGNNQSVGAGGEVTLTGSASDADSDTLSYQWEQIEGTAVSLSDATAQSATFTASSAGQLTFRFTATDAGGASGSDTVTVAVEAGNMVDSGGSSGGGGSFGFWTLCLLFLSRLVAPLFRNVASHCPFAKQRVARHIPA